MGNLFSRERSGTVQEGYKATTRFGRTKKEEYHGVDSSIAPTLLIRTMANKEDLVRFEEHLKNIEDAALLFGVFKPLVYFEKTVAKNPTTAKPLYELFQTIYLEQDIEALLNCGCEEIFLEFINAPKPSAQTFYNLREALDHEISRRYLLDFRSKELRETQIVNAPDRSNSELDLAATSREHASKTIRKMTSGTGSVVSKRSRLSLGSYSGSLVDDMDNRSVISSPIIRTQSRTSMMSGPPPGLAPPPAQRRRKHKSRHNSYGSSVSNPSFVEMETE